jgi:hypothetical protein
MTEIEVNRRKKAVEELLKARPDITCAEGGKLLGMGKTSFLRYKHKIQSVYYDIDNKVQADTYKRAYKDLKAKIMDLEKVIQIKNEELCRYASIADMRPVSDIKVQTTGKREVVPVIVASDWHIEETVSAAITNGLNEYNLTIAEESIRQFFSKACNAIKRSKESHTVNTVVLAILGDIINGVLRSEDLESNQTTSVDAVAIARSLIYKGIKTLVVNTGCKIRVLCCVGNHGRLTDKIHYSNQVHNSLEYLLYKTLERDFRDNNNVTFIVSEAPYIIQPIFGVKVRFHHGHAARFNGGIGGLAVPVIRKTQQMNTIEHADLDVIGHFHSAQVFSNVIVNGSLVGSNGFSMSLGLPHDIPKQTYFEIDSKYGRTVVAPICIDRKVEKYVVDGI